MPDSLSVTVFAHDLPTADGTLACWTFVSDGLLGCGQKELVITIAHGPDQHPETIGRDLATLLVTVQQYARRGQLVDAGDVTVFGAAGPGGARGIGYVRPQPMDGVELPRSALSAIPLMGDEARFAHQFGLTRIMARLARHYRYYPCPPWWVPGRSAVAASPGDDTSILAQVRLAHVRGVSGRVELEGLRLRIGPAGQARFLEALDRAPRDVAFALVLDPDAEADGLLVWLPGMQGFEAATPGGSRAERLSIAFVSFAVGAEATGVRNLEDGVGVMCDHAAWQALVEAVRRAEAWTMQPSPGEKGLTLEWISHTYVSPVDGASFVVDEGWTTYRSDGPKMSWRALSRIVLLVDQRELAKRVTVSDLTAYLDAIERAFCRVFGDRPDFIESFVRVELRPGEPVAVTERGDDDTGRVAELVAGVEPPAISGGLVAFEFRLTNHPDAL